jgi:hypothetical protein
LSIFYFSSLTIKIYLNNNREKREKSFKIRNKKLSTKIIILRVKWSLDAGYNYVQNSPITIFKLHREEEGQLLIRSSKSSGEYHMRKWTTLKVFFLQQLLKAVGGGFLFTAKKLTFLTSNYKFRLGRIKRWRWVGSAKVRVEIFIK